MGTNILFACGNQHSPDGAGVLYGAQCAFECDSGLRIWNFRDRFGKERRWSREPGRPVLSAGFELPVGAALPDADVGGAPTWNSTGSLARVMRLARTAKGKRKSDALVNLVRKRPRSLRRLFKHLGDARILGSAMVDIGVDGGDPIH
jgi:hypothetical protein